MSSSHLTFGLTGGIASGKSTVARLLRERGIPTVDADLLARQVVQPGELGLARVVDAFGDVLLPNGELNRPRLAALVFQNEAARLQLNSILHPLIQARAQEQLREFHRQGAELVAYEVPLLFETQQADKYRPVVLVALDRAEQVRRGLERGGLDRAELERRIDCQWPLEKKRALADLVIENTGGLEHLNQEVARVVAELTRMRKLAAPSASAPFA